MMKIIGLNFKGIKVERKKDERSLKINTDILIKDIRKREISMVGGEVFCFDFEFIIKYEEDVAELIFSGEVLIIFEDKEIKKEILEKWKDKKILEKIRIPLFNFIFSKCNVKAIQFEEDLNLPIHIPLPKISLSEEKNESSGDNKK